MNKARLPTLKNATRRLGTTCMDAGGRATQEQLPEGGTTCPTIHPQEYEYWSEIYNTAWIVQAEIHKTSRLNVGHGTNVSLPNLRPALTKNQQGITYIEIMIVVVILGIIAVVAMPNLASNDHRKLDIAAEEIVQAIRFARIESIRTAVPHGVIVSTLSDSAKVYRLLSGTVTYDVYHPVDKKIYILNLRTDAATEGVDLLNYSIYYQGTSGNKQYIEFNENGNPKLYELGSDYMLNDSATITLSYAGQTRLISVAPMTGRVTVQ